MYVIYNMSGGVVSKEQKNTMLKLDFQMHFDVYVRVFRHLVFVYVYIQCCKFGIFCQLWPWGNNAMR